MAHVNVLHSERECEADAGDDECGSSEQRDYWPVIEGPPDRILDQAVGRGGDNEGEENHDEVLGY
jgi:hypothetical protein